MSSFEVLLFRYYLFIIYFRYYLPNEIVTLLKQILKNTKKTI